jgi:hypothetical protein
MNKYARVACTDRLTHPAGEAWSPRAASATAGRRISAVPSSTPHDRTGDSIVRYRNFC